MLSILSANPRHGVFTGIDVEKARTTVTLYVAGELLPVCSVGWSGNVTRFTASPLSGMSARVIRIVGYDIRLLTLVVLFGAPVSA